MAEQDMGSGALDRLEEELRLAGRGMAKFESELAGLQRVMEESSRSVELLGRGLESGLRQALTGLLRDGAKLSDVLKDIGRQVADSAFRSATRSVSDATAAAIGNLAAGALPFAKGGVVSGPSYFGMRGGLGLMGEAGPEAIMPLARGPDGRLGVAASGSARPVNVVFNISTPDVAGFRRSQSQIAAQMGRVLAKGERNG